MKGLPPDVDYEVRADFRGQISEKKTVSALLDREDNLVNFQLDIPIERGRQWTGLRTRDPNSRHSTSSSCALRSKCRRAFPRQFPRFFCFMAMARIAGLGGL